MSRTCSCNGMDDLSPGGVFFWVAVDKEIIRHTVSTHNGVVAVEDRIGL